MSEDNGLVNQEGPTSIHIDFEVKGNGDLLFSGHDMGEAPEKCFGKSDHEYWLTVPAYEKENLLIALIEEHYAGDACVMSKLQELMESKKITHYFDSY